MLRRTVRALGLPLVMLAFGAALVAQDTRPPAQKEGTAKGQAYDIEVVLEGQTYTGTITLEIAKSTVTGKMVIDQPIRVTGDVAGTLKGEALALDYQFTAEAENPCTGRVVVAAKMPADRGSATGTLETTGCSEAPQQGTFSLKKRAPSK